MPKLSLCHNWKLTCLKQSELPFQLYLSVGSFRKQTKKTNRLVADIVTLATQIIIATWIHSILVLKKINSFPRHWLSEWCESTTHLFNISFFFEAQCIWKWFQCIYLFKKPFIPYMNFEILYKRKIVKCIHLKLVWS